MIGVDEAKKENSMGNYNVNSELMMSKSKDLRKATVAYQKEGHTYNETAKSFGVVKSTIQLLTSRFPKNRRI